MAIECVKCEATGLCLRSHASGRQGFFYKLPPPTAKKCVHCEGSGRCPQCKGAGQEAGFVWEPQIYVQSESTRPSPITAAAICGAGCRYIDVPKRVLAKTTQEQYDWVGWCVQHHFRCSRGECFLFGKIRGYAYRPRQEDYTQFDIERNLIDVTA